MDLFTVFKIIIIIINKIKEERAGVRRGGGREGERGEEFPRCPRPMQERTE